MKMQMCKVIHKESGKTLVNDGRIAQSFYTRLKGLMFDERMNDFDGLLITRCNSIHTFFMNFPIDAIFLNKENRVVKIKKNLKPWRVTPMYFKASSVLEIRGGTLPDSVKENDLLEVICLN